MTKYIYAVLRDLVPFIQFKKREKHPWRLLLLVKLQICNLTKSNNPPVHRPVH